MIDASHADRRAWLIAQGVGYNHTGAILWWMKNGAAIRPGGDELIDRQYAGAKAALRPVYERVAPVIEGFGDDVVRGLRGTYVSFGRPKQFAIVQPSTRTRVDVGLRLPGVAPRGRLLDAGPFGSGSITHRVALAAPEDLDAEPSEAVTRPLAEAVGGCAPPTTRAADRAPSARRPSSRARGRRRGPRGRRRSRVRAVRGGPPLPRARRGRR